LEIVVGVAGHGYDFGSARDERRGFKSGIAFMGSMISLAVGRLEVDWGKNNGFVDHSALFQVDD
jgi:hypothetical protein